MQRKINNLETENILSSILMTIKKFRNQQIVKKKCIIFFLMTKKNSVINKLSKKIVGIFFQFSKNLLKRMQIRG